MADEVLGVGVIKVEVRESIDRDLSRANAELKRKLAELERQRASIKFDGDLTQLDEAIKKAEAKVAKLDKKSARVNITGKDETDKALKAAKKNLEDLERAKTRALKNDNDRARAREAYAKKEEGATQRLKREVVKAEGEKATAAKRSAKAIADADKKAASERVAASRRVTAEGEKARRAEVAGEQKRLKDSLASQRAEAAAKQALVDKTARLIADSEKRAERDRLQSTRKAAIDGRKARMTEVSAENAAIRAAANERSSIIKNEANIQQGLNRRAAKLKKLAAEYNRVGTTPQRRDAIKLDAEKALREYEAMRAKLTAAGLKPIHQHIKLDRDRMRAGDVGGVLTSLEHQAKRGEGALQRWSAALADTAIRIGPITTSIGGLVRALALLGPIVWGVVGAAGALVGALGAGVVGAVGTAAAGVGAFGAVLGSSALLLPSLMKNYKALTTLQKAYDTQVLKTGAGSDKAKAKLVELNHAMGAVSPSTRSVFKDVKSLKGEWNKLAQKSRPAFLDALASGVKTARYGIKKFGPEVTQSFDLVSKGVQRAMKGLRGKEAGGIFKTLFDQGQKALPSFMHGMTNLAAAVGHFAAAFSKMLPSLGKGFEKWSAGLRKITQDGPRMHHIVQMTVSAMRSFGHFAQAAGSALTRFFGGGVKPGIGLMDKMTKGLNKWARDPDKISKGFAHAVDTAERLWKALKPLWSLFSEFVTIMRPFSNIMLAVSGAIGKVAAEFLKLGAVKDLLKAAFAIFLVGRLVSTIGTVVGLVKNLTTAMRTLGGLKVGGAVLNALTGGGAGALSGAIRGAPGIRNLARGAGPGALARLAPPVAATGVSAAEGVALGAAAAPIARTARAAETGASKLVKFATRAGSMAGPIGLGVAAVVSLAYGLTKLFESADKIAPALSHMRNDFRRYNAAVGAMRPTHIAAAEGIIELRQNSLNLVAAQRDVSDATREVNRLQREGKTHTRAYKDAVLNQKEAVLSLRTAQLQEATVTQNLKNAIAGETKNRKEAVKQSKLQLKDAREAVKQSKPDKASPLGLMGIGDNIKALHEYIKSTKGATGAEMLARNEAIRRLAALEGLARAQYDVKRAQELATLSTLNEARALKGFAPIAQQTAGYFANLDKRTGSKEISTKISLKFDDPKKAGSVAKAASKAANAGVSKGSILKITANAKSAEDAIRRLNRLALRPKILEFRADEGRALIAIARLKGIKLPRKVLELLEHGSPTVIAAIRKLIAARIPSKTLAMYGNAVDAFNKARAVARIVLPNLVTSILGDNNPLNAVLNALPLGQIIGSIFVGVKPRKTGWTGILAGVLGSLGFAQGGSTRLRTREPNQSHADNFTRNAFKDASSRSPRRVKSGRYTEPTLMIGEERRAEYVIATNPRYREQNKHYLARAANDLGMSVVDTARKGKWHPRKPTNAQKYGAIDESSVRKEAAAAKKRRDAFKRWDDREPSKPRAPKRANGEKAKAFKRRQDHYRNVTLVAYGDRHKKWAHHPPNGLHAKDVDTAKERRKKLVAYDHAYKQKNSNFNAVHAANAKITKLTNLESAYGTAMDNAERAGDPKAFNRWRLARLKVLFGDKGSVRAPKKGSLLWYLRQAKRFAGKSNYGAAIERRMLNIEGDAADTKGNTFDYRDDSVTLESFLRAHTDPRDRTKKVKRNLLAEFRALELAQSKAASTADTADDEPARKGLEDFYNMIIKDVGTKSKPGLFSVAPIEVKKALYDALAGVLPGTTTTSGTAPPTGAEQTTFLGQERQRVLNDFGGNAYALGATGGGVGGPNDVLGMRPSHLATALAAGDNLGASFAAGGVGTAGGGAPRGSSGALAGGGSTTKNFQVVNNFDAPPPDPHTWSKGMEHELGGLI